MRELLNAGAEIDSVDNCGDTPLLVALRCGYLESAELLLKNGADFEHQGRGGTTPREAAARIGGTELVERLQSIVEARIGGIDEYTGDRPHQWVSKKQLTTLQPRNPTACDTTRQSRDARSRQREAKRPSNPRHRAELLRAESTAHGPPAQGPSQLELYLTVGGIGCCGFVGLMVVVFFVLAQIP